MLGLMVAQFNFFEQGNEEAENRLEGFRYQQALIEPLAEPRSAYHLDGPARSEWEHSILRVDALRYSITFRTMRGA